MRHFISFHRDSISAQRVLRLAYIPSASFNHGGTTTWIEALKPNGDVYSGVLEDWLDQDTEYPVDPELTGLTAAYALWKHCQMHGKLSARRYVLATSENAGDGCDPHASGYYARRNALHRARSKARMLTKPRQQQQTATASVPAAA